MLNNNHKNLTCAFSESLISYLYDEIGGAEKAEFEAHLVNCAACSDELSELGFARTAVYEWRVEEFDSLATPFFETPVSVIKTPETNAVSPTWISGWQNLFSFKPMFALATAAIFVALFGIGLKVFNLRNGIESNQDLAKAVNPNASPTIDKSIEKKDEIAQDVNKSMVSEILPSKVSVKKPVASKITPIKTASNSPISNSVNIVPTKVLQRAENVNNKPPVVKKSAKIPTLIDAPEEEDKSVRLADLFEEIGTR